MSDVIQIKFVYFRQCEQEMLRRQRVGQPERLQPVPGAVPSGPLPDRVGGEPDLGLLGGLLQPAARQTGD